MSVCLSAQAVTFVLQMLGSSFSVYRYILTTSRSCLGIKVIGLRSRSTKEITYFNKLLLLHAYIALKLTHKVKVI